VVGNEKGSASEFQADLIGRLNHAQAVTGYSFDGIRKLIEKRGAVGAALQLLDLSNMNSQPEGFRVLSQSALLLDSLEQTVIDWAESGLFPAVIMKNAKARLLLDRIKTANAAANAARRSGP
jgi:hypothetical protein